jgi:hypothetical protein
MIKHEDYNREAAERCTQTIMSDFVYFAKLTDAQRVIVENAYRRGFFQGFHEAVHGMETGLRLDDLKDHLDPKLYVWRYAEHNGNFEFPPVAMDNGNDEGWDNGGATDGQEND